MNVERVNIRIVARYKDPGWGDPQVICEYTNPFFADKICQYLNLTQPSKSGWSYHVEKEGDPPPIQPSKE